MRLDQQDTSAFNTHLKSGRFSHSAKVIADDVVVTQNGSIVNAFDPGGGTYSVILPPYEAGRFYVVAHIGTSGTLEVVDAHSAPVAELGVGDSTLLFASDEVWTGVSGGFALDVFGYTGVGHSEGLVPDPGAGPVDPDLADRRFLSELGWSTVAGLAASNAYFRDHKGGAVTLTPTGSETLEFVSADNKIVVLAQSGTSPKSIKLTLDQTKIDITALLNYNANAYVDHSAVTMTAGLGLSGGGTIAATRTFDFAPSELVAVVNPVLADSAVMDLAAGGPRRTTWSDINAILNHNLLLNYFSDQHVAHSGVSIVAGSGLSGGGTIDSSRVISLDINELPEGAIATNDYLVFYDNSEGDHNKISFAGLNASLDVTALVNYNPNANVDHTTVSINTVEGVQGGGTIAATRTLKLDISGLPTKGVPTTSDFGVIFDSAAGAHKKVALDDWPGGDGGGLTDAPSDSDTYAREDGAWKKIPTITVASSAPVGPEVGDVWIDTGTGTTVTILDTGVWPNDRYESGAYLAFQAVNNYVLTRSQNMVIETTTFQNGVTFNCSWPDGADDSVKSFNAVDYGNYLDTEVPVPIVGSKVSLLDVLKVRTVWTYSFAVDAANLTMDFFLFTGDTSTIPTMLCEFQIFYHTPDSTKAFVDSVTNLGTYTSPAIDSTPSIAWKVGRQTANYFGTPYYLFYPVDQSDKFDMTFDIKAALEWLMAPNPTTSVTYLTGNEYWNGLGTGIEPLRKTGSATLVTYAVTYEPGDVPGIPPDLPPNTNLIPLAARADFTNAFWSAQGLATLQVGGYTEAVGTNVHGVGAAASIAVAASTIYTAFVDVDVSAGQPWMFFQVMSSDFASDAQAYYDVAGVSVSGGAASGAFTAFSSDIALLTTGKTRIYMTFTTGPATTAVYFSLRSATGAYGTSYAGSTSNSVALENPFLYT